MQILEDSWPEDGMLGFKIFRPSIWHVLQQQHGKQWQQQQQPHGGQQQQPHGGQQRSSSTGSSSNNNSSKGLRADCSAVAYASSHPA